LENNIIPEPCAYHIVKCLCCHNEIPLIYPINIGIKKMTIECYCGYENDFVIIEEEDIVFHEYNSCY